MAKNKRKPNKPPKQNPPQKKKLSLQERLQSLIPKDSPILRFLIGFAVLMGLFYLLFSTDFYKSYIYTPVVELSVWLGSGILNIFGQGTTTSGFNIASPKGAVNVGIGCDGIEVMALFGAAVLAFPLAWRVKWRGLLAGFAFLFVMNLIRIISLWLAQVFWPEAFDFLHFEFWQALFLILGVGSWVVWVRWGSREIKN